jgi:hypothetical protein
MYANLHDSHNEPVMPWQFLESNLLNILNLLLILIFKNKQYVNQQFSYAWKKPLKMTYSGSKQIRKETELLYWCANNIIKELCLAVV